VVWYSVCLTVFSSISPTLAAVLIATCGRTDGFFLGLGGGGGGGGGEGGGGVVGGRDEGRETGTAGTGLNPDRMFSSSLTPVVFATLTRLTPDISSDALSGSETTEGGGRPEPGTA